MFFQIEQAHWFYEDFIVPDSPILPRFSKLKAFAKEIFNHCVLLAPLSDQFSSLFDDFNSYKSTIPVCGTIILNKSLDKLLLCKSYKGNSWSFPRGKINQDEDVFDCAMRETLEETGFDCWEYASRHDHLTHFENETKKIKLFIVPFVDENYPFAPLTRCGK